MGLSRTPDAGCNGAWWWRFLGLSMITTLSLLIAWLFLSNGMRAVEEAGIYGTSSSYAEQLEDDYVDSTPALLRDRKYLVCYYDTTSTAFGVLPLSAVTASLCTHINIGPANVHNSTIALSDKLVEVLRAQLPLLQAANPHLKCLLWLGGGGSGGFSEMVRNHLNRKLFLRSARDLLHQYKLDGLDLDWEFPSAYKKERQHFSQLLYEIRREYSRGHRNYLLSVAVAAPESISVFAYDVREINTYADYVNLMTYDFHFYSKSTPFTGLNAPLYARSSEHGLLATLNINHSVSWWLSNGLERDKLIVGLPTYGHSFTLVNPFNKVIGAPANGDGYCGNKGYTTYSDICRFTAENLVAVTYDNATCSPFLTSGSEWISFENEESFTCKVNFVKSLGLGGVMIFSLNTDDSRHICDAKRQFPLTEIAKNLLLDSN